ncbi:HD domain-containing protein [Candidatus Curtissbacteria bacterium]|nr:HD domain-containing protein [Candidatus Curtissbacteria bacterium]
MTRDDATKILEELKNSPNMKKHGLAVGFTMSALYDYFQQKGKSPEIAKEDWEVVGILHDADYEITNKSLELHTEETTKKLQAIGADQKIIDAIRGHCNKAPRETLMAKSVYAADELTGLIVAAALVQPDKKLASVTVDSVLRKFKDKYFAAGANRDQIKTCETELAIPLEEFVALTLRAMQNNAEELGL